MSRKFLSKALSISPMPGRFLLGLVLAVSMSCQTQAQHDDWHTDGRDIMGTRITLTFWEKDPSRAHIITELVFAEMQRLDQLLSPYKENSELSKVNRNAHKAPVEISEKMLYLLDKAIYYGKITNGAFDISYASLGQFYDYRRGQQPTAEQLQAFKSAIDYRKIELDRENSKVYFRHPKLIIDLGGIAKGYAVDRVITILKGQGVKHASISAGGDSRMLGDKRGRPWIVGIKNPRLAGPEAEKITDAISSALVLPLQDIAISTSGDYERYFIDHETGERIHHIIKPQSGRSASGVMSVSVLGPLGFDTDPLSTSVFVMGVRSGLELIDRLPGFDAVIIDAHSKVHYSQGLTPP